MKQLFVCGQLTLAWRLIAVFDFHQHGAASTCPTETNGDIRKSMPDLMRIENRAANLPQGGYDIFLIGIDSLSHYSPFIALSRSEGSRTSHEPSLTLSRKIIARFAMSFISFLPFRF